MTVAAIILAASPESALADADGMPSVRRIADVAWSGGAVPIIVVAHDPAGAVAVALAGAPVTLAEPAPVEGGPAGQMVRGIEVAMSEVNDTSGALIWPARMTWVGPETVTSLIEVHGLASDIMQTPSDGDSGGWPVLVPVSALEALRTVPANAMPDAVMDFLADAGVPFGVIDLGDPGTTHDRETSRSDLPPYTGPLEPPAGHVHEWGAMTADEPDDAPLEGPALAPYAPAASEVEA